MELLSRLEHALEGVVEGVFSRAFRAQLQPIEVAKRLTRELENHRAVSVNATYVPNVYEVHLAPETFASFQQISGRLLAELEQYLREFIVEHNYETVGPIAVDLVENPSIKQSEIQVTVASDALAVPSATPAPSVLRSYPTEQAAPERGGGGAAPVETPAQPAVQAPPVAMDIISGERVGQSIPLTDGMTLGRGPTNTLSFADPGMSRHHAAIVWEDDGWVIRDTGSTNGTMVNDRHITSHVLRVGDLIHLGGTEIRVK
ncbi:MAG TPA: DUF3662 and FHA domain-containing protein [Armatimonadota bacterium]|jgi:hypothetical protein